MVARNGATLEMRVARAFAEFDSRPYVNRRVNDCCIDPTTTHSREADLVISWAKPYDEALFLGTLEIECKSTKDHWVVGAWPRGASPDDAEGVNRPPWPLH